MTYERERSRERHLAGDPQAGRLRGESFAARESKQAQHPPGRSTLTESLAPRLVEPERELDAHLELARQQLTVLRAANTAGDHYVSGSAACEVRAAFRAAGTIARMLAERGERVAELKARWVSAHDEARSALELAFTPSPAAIREATAGTGRARWDREVAAWRVARGHAEPAPADLSIPAAERPQGAINDHGLGMFGDTHPGATAVSPKAASERAARLPSLMLVAGSRRAPSTQAAPPKQRKASDPAPEQQLPGFMMIITLLDASGGFITASSEPLYGDAPGGAFFGRVHGNRIDWKQGATAGEVVVEMSPRLGVQYDSKGRVTNPGVSIEQWLAVAGKGRARTVLIEIEPARIFQHDKSGRDGGRRRQPDNRAPHLAGTGTVGTTGGTAGGARDAGSTTRPDDGGMSTGHVPNAPIVQPGRDAKYPGEEDVIGKPGGAEKGPVNGKVGGHKEGSTRGKRGGTKTETGYFEDPAAPGRGTNDVTTDGSTPEGMVGGKGKKGDQGVPVSSGLLPMISVPRKIAPAVTLGMILLEADLANWADDVVKISFKLGKAAAEKGGTLSKIVAVKFNRHVDREMDKIAEALAKESQFIAKTADEQAEILRQIREAVEIETHVKLSVKLDQKAAEGEQWAKAAAAEQDRFTSDNIRDSLEYADAARRAKDALPPKGASAQGQAPASGTTRAPVGDPKAPATSGTASTGARTHDPHGKPTGKRAQVSPKDKDPANIRALERENESADVLARHGHSVEQGPKVPGSKNPDYRIDGEIFDNYAPTTTKVRSIWSEVETKITSGQTSRIVLNLSGNQVELAALKAQFDKWQIRGLKQVIVVKGEVVVYFWP